MTERTYITVDPGGGVAWSNRNGVFTSNIPETRRDMIDLFKKIIEDNESSSPVTAYTEKVAAYIPDAGASMMFVYGRNVERPGCILETLGVRIIEITPQAWQKELGLGKSERIPAPRMPKGLKMSEKVIWRSKNKLAIQAARVHNSSAKREWKRKLKDESQRRFPTLKVTLQTCDALLLLDAAIQMEGEKLNL